MATYNQPEEMILRLSDAFRQKGEGAVDTDIELTVRMLNINYGKNKASMKHSWLVENIRQNNRLFKNIEKSS